MRKWATSRKGAIVILISGVVLLFLLFFCGLPGWRYLRDYGKPVSWTPLVIPTYSTGFATLTPTAEFPATQVFPTAPPSAVVYPTYTSVYIPPSVAPATAFPATALPPKPLWQLPVHWSDIYKLCKKGIDHKRENQSSDPAWDFCVLIGTKVYPIADGVVIYASVSDGFGLGGVVQIYHPCGWISTYGNLGKVFVRAGNNVGVETVIGEVGYAGENNPLKYGPVLHLAIETLGAYKIPDDIGRRAQFLSQKQSVFLFNAISLIIIY